MSTILAVVLGIAACAALTVALGMFLGWRDAIAIRAQAAACKRARAPQLDEAVKQLEQMVRARDAIEHPGAPRNADRCPRCGGVGIQSQSGGKPCWFCPRCDNDG